MHAPVKGERRKTVRQNTKNTDKIIHEDVKLIDEGAIDEQDEKLLQILQDYLIDFIQHSYNPLVEAIFDQISGNNAG